MLRQTKPSSYGEIVVDGLPVAIERKRVRNVNLRITPDGRLHVSAPPHTTDARIAEVVRQRRTWIDRAMRRTLARAEAQSLCTYSDGSLIWVWGTPYELRLVLTQDDRAVAVRTAEDVRIEVPAKLATSDPESVAARRAACDELLCREMCAELPSLAKRTEGETGLHATSWSVRRMTTRWGSCTPATGRIRLSSELAKYPLECAEYVAIHELCHTRFPDHGSGFHALLDSLCPDWRERKATLTEGQREGR